MKYYVGVDIGGTRIKLGVINTLGEIHNQMLQDTPKEFEAVVSIIKEYIRSQAHVELSGVGISTPGIIREDGYLQTSGAIKCFLHRNLKEELQKLLQLPVIVENDSKCAAAGERWLGDAKELSDFVCLTLGTAVGGAIYINGSLHRGLGGLAGEFGIALTGLVPELYNEQSYSYHAATVAGLCRNYSYAVHERVLDAQEIYRRKDKGDEVAKRCIEEFYHACATLFVNIAVFIGPEVILIGGGISNSEEAMQGMKREYERMCEEYHVLSMVSVPKLQPCKCKNEAGMLGAVYPFIAI